jgi:PAS domain S-box-containing protein
MSEELSLENMLQIDRAVLLDLFNDGYFLVNAQGKVLDVNQAACVNLGYSRAEFLQLYIADFDALYTQKGVEEVLSLQKIGQMNEFRTDLRKKDESILPVEVQVHKMEHQKQIYYAAIIKDISMALQMEASAAKQQLRVNQLFKAMTDGYALHEMIYNEQGKAIDYKFLDMNPAFEELTGLSRKNAIGKSVLTLLPGTESYWIDTFATVVQTGRSLRYQNYSKEIEKYFEVVAFCPGAHQFAVMVKDITEKVTIDKQRQQLEAQVRQSHKMMALGTLAGGISHDFKNILGIIMGHAERYMMQYLDQDGREQVEGIIDACIQGRNVVNQLMQFSRDEQTIKEPLALQPIVEDALRMFYTGKYANITIKKNISDQKHLVLADATQIQQVLLNLFTNAVQAMETKGDTIWVQMRILQTQEIPPAWPHKGQVLCLSIKDNGPGITPDNVHKVFDPYFSTKKLQNGTGLGLAVVHSIVQAHNGMITASSGRHLVQQAGEAGNTMDMPKMYEGAEFNVYLPVLDIANHDMPAHSVIDKKDLPTQEAQLPMPKGVIAVVEDEESMASLLKVLLEGAGLHVEVFTDPNEVVNAWQRGLAIELMLTDMGMPVMSGAELCTLFKQHNPSGCTILYSGYDEQELISNGSNLSAVDAILKKPARMAELLHTIRSVCNS